LDEADNSLPGNEEPKHGHDAQEKQGGNDQPVGRDISNTFVSVLAIASIGFGVFSIKDFSHIISSFQTNAIFCSKIERMISPSKM
jgi:hypothetical protein